MITVATEHKAVLDCARFLEKGGVRVSVLPVARDGRVDVQQVADEFTSDTRLVCVMAANNEIGVIQPLSELATLCKEREVPFFTDAAQALGRLPFSVAGGGPQLAAFSAHKIYGPKGVGALYVGRQRGRPEIRPLVYGGGHERGLRSGTLNVAGIVGFGVACVEAGTLLETSVPRIARLRDRLLAAIREGVDEVVVHGSMQWRLPGNLNISFARVEGDALLMGMGDVAVSSGSACTSDSLESSHVLRAIGASDAMAYSALRFGLGRGTTEAEVDHAAARVVSVVRRLRAQRAGA